MKTKQRLSFKKWNQKFRTMGTLKCVCSFISRDIRANQLEHTLFRVPMVSFVFIYWVVTVTADIRQNKTKKTPNFLIIFLKAEVKWKCPKLKWKCWSKIEQLFRQMSWVNSSFIGEKISRMILQINVLITGESNFDIRNIQEMFNWSEVHSESNNFFHFCPSFSYFLTST